MTMVVNSNIFEGVEKLLEIWFTGTGNLRNALPKHVWETEIFPKVGCSILLTREAHDTTAYVLSESSLFVSSKRIILKTCGTTQCLKALPMILEYTKKSNMVLDSVFYSRKNFLCPSEQPDLYKSSHFESESEFIDGILDSKYETKSLCFGPLNSSRWYLYIMEN